MKDLTLEHWETRKVRSYDVGIDKKVVPTALIKILHDAATQQVIKLGMSALELGPRGLGWVLTHQHLEIFERPGMGQQIKILTYPSGRERIYTYRDYKLFGMDGQLLAQAATTWLLMNIQERKISDYPDDIAGILEGTNKKPHLPRAQQITIPQMNEPVTHSKQFEALFMDMDFNGHVGNQHFFRWMLATLPDEWLARATLKHWHIRLKQEVFSGDQIVSKAKKLNNEAFGHVLLRNGQIVATGLSKWKP